jgi:FlaA1/EpsC-like NDP-sugar epimerase
LNFVPRLTSRMALILCHDVVVTALALLCSLYFTFPDGGLAKRAGILATLVPIFCVYAGIVYVVTGLYRPKWRFTSMPDLISIARASLILAISLLIADYVLVAPNVLGEYVLGKKAIAVYWVLQMFFLSGPRVVYRYFRHGRTRMQGARNEAVAALALGRTADVEVLLRAVESGAVQRLRILGILSPSDADQQQSVRGVNVIGRPSDLETVAHRFEARGTPIRRIIFTPSALVPEEKPESVLIMARRLGIAASHLPSLDGGGELRLSPVAPEDLLLRPGIRSDTATLGCVVRGRSVLVTGGGGSIGSEICRRVVDLGAARLMIVEHSEPALHAIAEEIAGRNFGGTLLSHIGDVRDRERMFALFEGFRPDIVFHAAALKHVPVLERDWAEGIKTNVFGSVNVCDAAVAAGATGVVMISTDKAVDPVSVLGITKRLAEMYCQSLDGYVRGATGEDARRTRLINVRFGNVLASNGSVVPKFRAQIEAGGPVTVTHPDMVRYFMTIGEACDLVITAAGHALEDDAGSVSVYVLNMGQPVRISALAERMIRLSGLEPGVDIDVIFTGLRPGERLTETLFSEHEPTMEIGLPGVLASTTPFPAMAEMRGVISELARALEQGDRGAIHRLVVPSSWREAGATGTVAVQAANDASAARRKSPGSSAAATAGTEDTGVESPSGDVGQLRRRRAVNVISNN